VVVKIIKILGVDKTIITEKRIKKGS